MWPFKKSIPPSPQLRQTDHRPARSVIMAPHVQFYYPDDLRYPDTQGPTVPGDGGYTSAGCGMVLYQDGATWDRGNLSLAGPVREFFARMMNGQGRTKQV